MPEAYPLSLRTVLRASKSRTQPASFRMAEPRRGYGYVERSGTDTPVFWEVAFRFTREEALIFQLWFNELINRGADEFTLPIRTEFGLITHVCRFLPDSLLDTSEEGETWNYKATIMARAQVIPEDYSDAAELIVGLPNWRNWASLLDLAISSRMPSSEGGEDIEDYMLLSGGDGGFYLDVGGGDYLIFT